MVDEKEFKAGLEKLSDEEIRSKRKHMSQLKKDLVDEVLENREHQRSEELARSNEAMNSKSLALAREANTLAREANTLASDANFKAQRSNRIAIAAVAIAIFVPVIISCL